MSHGRPASVMRGTSSRGASALRGRVTVYRTPKLPQNSVRAIHQDGRGYLWFGTEEGVVRFDGFEWQPFRISDGLVFGFVQAIAGDRGGCIWIGTRMGLSRFDPVHLGSGPWRSFTTADGLPHDDVRAIAEGAGGLLWIATAHGVVRLDPRTLRIEPECELRDAAALLVDSRGVVWAGSHTGGAVWRDPETGGWNRLELPDRRVSSLAEAKDGAIWIGTLGSGALRVDRDRGTTGRLTREDGLPDDCVTAMLCDRAGTMWFGSESGGVARAVPPSADKPWRWSLLELTDGLPVSMNFSILEDRDGGFWLGSLVGLVEFVPTELDRAKSWTSYTVRDGLSHNLIVAIAEDAAGRFWFGTYGRGASALGRADGVAAWESVGAAEGLANGIVRAIATDAAGRIWLGTFGAGLARFDPQTRELRAFTTEQGLAGNLVRVLVRGPDGRFWAGTDGGGISVFDALEEEPAFENLTVAEGLPGSRISGILHDSRGRVWATTYDAGAGVCENGRWRTVSVADGLPANAVYCVAEDPSGRLWFGTGGSGLASFDGIRWRTWTANDGLPNDTIYQILVESERSIYASTNRGVFRLRLEEEGEVIVAFDRGDGLADDECNGGASLCDSSGRFWFGTLDGVSYIDPSRVPERIPPCAVFLTGFEVNGAALDLQGGAVVEDSKTEFSFHYGAVEFVAPEKIRYRTRLAGFDGEWSRVTSERAIRYTNLRPGSYRLEVRARNWGGEWSEPASLAFEVVPDPLRLAREEAIERERIERKVLETAHAKLQQLAQELHAANEKLLEKEVLLELQAREDPLTGLPNRRHLDQQLQLEFDRATRFGRPLSMIMVDLDRFKSINDRFSHASGDLVLRTAGWLMKTAVRSIDTVARYGGDEFVIILPETSEDAAAVVCEKIRAAIAAYPWENVDAGLTVTASFGCTGDTSVASAGEMLHTADQNLFNAKRAGRNRVCV